MRRFHGASREWSRCRQSCRQSIRQTGCFSSGVIDGGRARQPTSGSRTLGCRVWDLNYFRNLSRRDCPHHNGTRKLDGPAMVTKCSNPSCSASFRFLHCGKLFHFEKRPQLTDDVAARTPANSAEMYWLCDVCAAEFTLAADVEHGVRVVPLAHRAFRAAS